MDSVELLAARLGHAGARQQIHRVLAGEGREPDLILFAHELLAVLVPRRVHGPELVPREHDQRGRELRLRELGDEGADEELLEHGGERLEVVDDQQEAIEPRDRLLREAEQVPAAVAAEGGREVGEERVGGDVVEVAPDAGPVGPAEEVADRARQRARVAEGLEAVHQPPRFVERGLDVAVDGGADVEVLAGLGDDLVQPAARLEQRDRGGLDLGRRRGHGELGGDAVDQRAVDRGDLAHVGKVVVLRRRRQREAPPRELAGDEREEVAPRLLVRPVDREPEPARCARRRGSLGDLEDVAEKVRLADAAGAADADDAQAGRGGTHRVEEARHLRATVSVVGGGHGSPQATAAPSGTSGWSLSRTAVSA